MSMTISDIAKLSGVAKSTVSRYFNGGSISDKTKKKIEKVVQETDFHPNTIASRLKSKKNYLIGVIVDELSTRSVGILIDSMQQELNKHGYQLFILSNRETENQEDKTRSLQLLADQNVDAIVFGSSQVTREQIQFLTNLKIPVLILGQKNSVFPYRKIDDYKGGFLMGKYISTLKPQRPLFLSMPLYDLAAGTERLNGFVEGAASIKSKVIECGYNPESVYQHKEEIISYKPDVVVCASDYLILGLLHIIKELDLSFPADIRIAGFGNYDFSNKYALDLTSIDFDYPTLGINTARAVINMLAENEKDMLDENDYNTRLIERNSTANSTK